MFMIILERLLHKVELSAFISVDEYLLKILTEHENQFCFVFFFPPTTRKWKLSVKKKTEIELKYFSMLFFRDMYIASFFFPVKCGLKPLLIICKKKFEQC